MGDPPLEMVLAYMAMGACCMVSPLRLNKLA